MTIGVLSSTVSQMLENIKKVVGITDNQRTRGSRWRRLLHLGVRHCRCHFDPFECPTRGHRFSTYFQHYSEHRRDTMGNESTGMDRDNLSSISTILGLSLFCFLVATIIVRKIMIHRQHRRFAQERFWAAATVVDGGQQRAAGEYSMGKR